MLASADDHRSRPSPEQPDRIPHLVRHEKGCDVPELAARRALKEIEKPAEINGHCVQVGATLGIAIGPDNGRRIEDLMHAADLAMYEGKEAGRGSVFLFKAA